MNAENVQTLINLQLNMFVMMVIGYFLRRLNIIGEEGKKNITDLVIDVVLPANIIKSFMITFNREILVKFAWVFVISIAIQIMCTFIAAHFYWRLPDSRKKVFQYGTVCSNAGFLGNPVSEGVFGSMGLTYASIFLIPQRIVMWSAGVSYFTEQANKKELVKKLIKHPCIIAVFVGMFFMVAQIRLPQFLENSITSVSNCCTFLSMMIIGMILVGVDFKTMLDRSLVIYSVIRLLFIPFVVYLACHALSMDGLVTGVCTLLTAMPAGATTAILAAKYNGDAIFASKCVVFSTILSLFTTPVWSIILVAGLS